MAIHCKRSGGLTRLLRRPAKTARGRGAAPSLPAPAANFAKGLFKVTALGVVMAIVLWPDRFLLDALVRSDPSAMLGTPMTLTRQLLVAVVASLAVLLVRDAPPGVSRRVEGAPDTPVGPR